MIYTYIDGDNIGLKIESSFLENNEISLKLINEEVKSIVDKISEYLNIHNQKIIFSGADGIICKGENIDISAILDFIRQINSSITFSIGVGSSLKDSYIALRYAKSLNKNIAVKQIGKKFIIIDGEKTKREVRNIE